MSGVFYNGKWLENAALVCKNCGKPVYESEDSRLWCFDCGRTIQDNEARESDDSTLPIVMIAQPENCIPINGAVEFL